MAKTRASQWTITVCGDTDLKVVQQDLEAWLVQAGSDPVPKLRLKHVPSDDFRSFVEAIRHELATAATDLSSAEQWALQRSVQGHFRRQTRVAIASTSTLMVTPDLAKVLDTASRQTPGLTDLLRGVYAGTDRKIFVIDDQEVALWKSPEDRDGLRVLGSDEPWQVAMSSAFVDAASAESGLDR